MSLVRLAKRQSERGSDRGLRCGDLLFVKLEGGSVAKKIDVEEDDLKEGLLGLVMALVEIIRDTLRTEALKRMENGRLKEEEIDRLGQALQELDRAIEEIKREQGIEEAVQSTRDGLNELVDDLINPERWVEERKEESRTGN